MRKLLDADLARPEHSLRDIVALSTLPALWLGADTVRMAESLAAALYTTLGADFVYVRLEESGVPTSVAQVDRYRTDPGLAAALGPGILAWAREHDPEEWLELPGRAGGGMLRVAAQPVGFDASFGVVAAGFAAPQSPSALKLTMLNVAATQAYTAVQNAKLLRALREADRRKDEFLAMLSHELRNPLAPIVTAIQLMRQRGTSFPELPMLERQSAHLTRLVDDLLDVSRITRGKIELRREPIEIADVLARGMEMAQPLLEQLAHPVQVEMTPARGLVVHGDLERLAQAVFNLLSNAAKYSPRGSPIAVRAWRDADRIRLSVRDQGAGIAADMMERIFDMFVQQEQTLARSEGGLGLGLTIVRRLVELHDGRVAVRSAGPSSGSEFTVELPASAGAPTPGIRGPAPALAASGGRRILLVDDNVDAAGALAELLRVLGHDVTLAHDGMQALAEARRYRPEVALIDIGLPGMDGYELARRLSEERDAGTAIRLVAVTGYGLEKDRERSAGAGFSEHLVKPVELAQLQRLL